MARISINELTTYRWSFEEDIHHYLAAGVSAISVWRQKLSDFGDEKGIELLADSNLAVSSLLWAGGFTGNEGRSFKESIQDARDAIRTASELNAGCLIVYSGGRAGHTHNHARRLLRSALDELTPMAAEFGVTLALEPMHQGCAADWTFLTDLDETIEWVAAGDCPNLKLAFDTYHFGQGDSICDRMAQLVDHIAIVQLGDARRPPDGEQDRCRLGEGMVPLEQIVGALVANGYDGYFDIELMGEEIEAADYRELIAQSKQFVDHLLGAAQAS